MTAVFLHRGCRHLTRTKSTTICAWHVPAIIAQVLHCCAGIWQGSDQQPLELQPVQPHSHLGEFS